MTSPPPNHLLSSVKDVLFSNASLRAGFDFIESNSDASLVVETILRLCAGAPCPSWITPPLPPSEWNNARTHLLSTFDGLQPNGSQSSKRPRESDPSEQSTNVAKKAKLVDDANDPPIFTLHNISFTSPIRKKADITVHKSSLRFTDPKDSKSNVCDPISINLLRHAFMVSTPGKAKPHWTTIILPEYPTDPPVIFGCDATSTAPQSTTKHPSPPQLHPKGSPTKPLIHSLFAYFPSGPAGLVDLYEPKPSDFQSALGGGQSIDAYIGAKDGHLHFFSHGVLWGEKKPCIWFPTQNIVDMHTGVSSGRSFTLYISVKGKASTKVPSGNDDDDEDEVEMHDFALIDSKEEGPVKAWIASHKQQFAVIATPDNSMQVDATSSSKASENKTMAATSSGRPSGPIRLMDAVLDENDSEDGDFVSDSNSDSSGSGASVTGGDDAADGDGDVEEEEEAESGNDGEDADHDIESESDAREDRENRGSRSDDADELDDNYQRIPIPAGMKVSGAAAAVAQQMVGEAFGIPPDR